MRRPGTRARDAGVPRVTETGKSLVALILGHLGVGGGVAPPQQLPKGGCAQG